MKLSMVTLLAAALLIVTNSSAVAGSEMIVVNKRYIVPNFAITGNFYQNKNKPVTFAVRIPGKDSMGGTKYICPEFKWDWDKIEAASQKFANLLNSGKSFDVIDFLKSAGLGECKNK